MTGKAPARHGLKRIRTYVKGVSELATQAGAESKPSKLGLTKFGRFAVHNSYLAIDVGATKTLLAIFSKDGKLQHEQKIATNRKYDRFLADLKPILQQAEFKDQQISACCCGLPGRLDRKKGIGIRFGNLSWTNIRIRKDLESLIGKIPIYIENDAKLAGLYQASTHKEYKKVLYITLSTGIGGGVITNGNIDPDFLDFEPGNMILEHEGGLQEWEDFASGKALVERFGKKAAQLDNPFAWKSYAKDIARGLDILLAVLQPDVVIIGGSVGAHLEKFADSLKDELKKYSNNMVPIPPIIKADKAEEAVIYGCYEYIRQNA